MNDLNGTIQATQTSLYFCDYIINDPKTPPDEKAKYEKYRTILIEQQKINVETIVSNYPVK